MCLFFNSVGKCKFKEDILSAFYVSIITFMPGQTRQYSLPFSMLLQNHLQIFSPALEFPRLLMERVQTNIITHI